MSPARGRETVGVRAVKSSKSMAYFDPRSTSPARTETTECGTASTYEKDPRGYWIDTRTATPLSPISVPSSSSSSTSAGSGGESNTNGGFRFGELQQPTPHTAPADDEGTGTTKRRAGLQHPSPAHLERRQAPVVGFKLTVDPRRKPLGSLAVPNSNSNGDDGDDDSGKYDEDYAAHSATALYALPPIPEPQTDHISHAPAALHLPAQNQKPPSKLTFSTTRNPLKPRLVDVNGILAREGRKKIVIHKSIFQASLIGFNGFLIFYTWYFLQYWWVLMPFISMAVAINTAMVLSLCVRYIWTQFRPRERIVPETPETLVMLVPCYNENQEELERSLESLVQQRKIENHKQAIVIICDGRVRGPGMAKTTAEYLLHDVLKDNAERKHIAGGYTAWDQVPMDVTFQRGRYQDLPYVCIIKDQNQGKRDSLIAIRSWLYYFNKRSEALSTIHKPTFFDDLCSFLIQDAGIEHVDTLVGMDADTVLDQDCVWELIQEVRYPQTMGVAGYVQVDWKDESWALWRLFQNAEYTVTQCLRRLHQGRVTHKVSVLPGACQILRICEESCCDQVLLDLFGRKPDLLDGLYKQIMASASEDGNHVCCMLTARPHARTRQAIRAKAYTDVPTSWAVYLSQRRRWSLGASCNDWLLAFGPGVLLWERLASFVSTFTWYLTPFIFATYASFIYVLIAHANIHMLYLAIIMIIPVIYYLTIPFWLVSGPKERFQFWAGLIFYLIVGPPCRFIVLCYSIYHMDQFGWGKTRMVIGEDGKEIGGDKAAVPNRTVARSMGDEEKSIGG